MAGSQAPERFQYPQYSSSHVHVSPGESGGAVPRALLGVPRQSDGGELMSLWAGWGMLDSQLCVGKGRLCFGGQREGRGVSNKGSCKFLLAAGPRAPGGSD